MTLLHYVESLESHLRNEFAECYNGDYAWPK
jgi:hypothetical protein